MQVGAELWRLSRMRPGSAALGAPARTAAAAIATGPTTVYAGHLVRVYPTREQNPHEMVLEHQAQLVHRDAGLLRLVAGG